MSVRQTASLLDRSLILQDEAGSHARFTWYEIIREYIAAHLVGEELSATRQRFCALLLGFAQQAHGELIGPESGAWMQRLVAEDANLRTALGFMAADPDGQSRFLLMCLALTRYWDLRGMAVEGRRWLTAALAQSQEHTAERGRALAALGNLALDAGDLSAAEAHFAEARQIHELLGDIRGQAVALGSLGTVKRRQGDFAAALELASQCAQNFHEIGDARGYALAHNNLTLIACDLGNHSAAYARSLEAIECFRNLGDKRGLMTAFLNSVVPALHLGEFGQALAGLRESLDLTIELSAARTLALIASQSAGFAQFQNENALSVRMHAATAACRERLGFALCPLASSEQTNDLDALRQTLGQEAFHQEWENGYALEDSGTITLLKSMFASHS